jgi:hypothetical protein
MKDPEIVDIVVLSKVELRHQYVHPGDLFCRYTILGGRTIQ